MSQRLLSFFWERLTKACSVRRDNYQRQWIGESHHSPHMGSANQAADGRNTTTDVGTLTDRKIAQSAGQAGRSGNTQRYTDQKSTRRTRRSPSAARMSRSSGSRTGYFFFQVAAAALGAGGGLLNGGLVLQIIQLNP